MNRYRVYDAGDGVAPVKAWVEGVPVDSAAIDQLKNTARMPFIFRHVAAMPDVHPGLGATVGSVIPTRGAIIPAAVGVDIGCGMMAVRLEGVSDADLPDSLREIRGAIENAVPVGFGRHENPDPLPVDLDAPRLLQFLDEKHPTAGARRKDSLAAITVSQLGTLGGGNHFIEICLDENGGVWVMLHSGSRGIGNILGQYFIELAREDMRRHFVNLPDRDLAYFPEGTDHFQDYVTVVLWAQQYAAANRERMMTLILKALRSYLPIDMERTGAGSAQAVNCHHNYVEKERHFGENVWITRKGAVRAREGELGIIPGSMGARSYIVQGRGNPESFRSCSHGAGRVMSRSRARRAITVAEHAAATAGVECRKDAGVLDESPAAYKPIDAVMAAQEDLVGIVHELKQVLCVKG